MFKTFASALVYSSVYAQQEVEGITAMAIPDYVAGLVYGLTGDNQLDEFEKCFTASDEIKAMGVQIYNEFAGDEIIQAFEDIGNLASMIPPLMTTCSTDLQDDLNEISEWAAIFKHPGDLLERVGKNWLVYHFQIHSDFKDIQSDWLSGDYFGAGEVSADFLTKVLTPGMPASAIP